MESNNQRYVPAIDHLRAFAAAWIVVFHAYHVISEGLARGVPPALVRDRHLTSNPLLSVIIEGHSAVGLFMVLSGFVLARAALGFEVQYWPFLKNRLLRIYPMFVVVILAGLALSGGKVAISELAMTLLPVGAVHASAGLGPFSNSLWAVAVELQFYLIFPFLMTRIAETGPRQLGLLILSAIVLRALVMVSSGDLGYVTYFTILGRIDEFAIGVFAAYFVRNSRPVPTLLFAPAAMLCIGVLYAYNQLQGFSSSAPWKLIWPCIEGAMWAAFIVTYLPVAEHLSSSVSRWLAAVGKVSFSMYLLHFVLVQAIGERIDPVMVGDLDPRTASILVGVFVILPATIVLSRLTYAAIEEPFLSLRVRYLGPDTRLQSATTQGMIDSRHSSLRHDGERQRRAS